MTDGDFIIFLVMVVMFVATYLGANRKGGS